MRYHDFFRNHVKGLKIRQGSQTEGHCPFHDDRHKSLSIDLETGLWKCHGGNCGKAGNALMFAELKGIPKCDVPSDKSSFASSRQIIGTYDYRDEEEKLLFQVVRYTPKAFAQRRPDGNNGWIWNMKGARHIPYRLPELAKGGDPVIVVEGEKHVDALIALGFTSTTNPGGAGKWKEEYSQLLTDRDVVLLPDNDAPGRKHMDAVARFLWHKTKSIKVLPLPGLPDKGDVLDWLANGGSAEELNELIANTTPLSSPPAEEENDQERHTENGESSSHANQLVALVEQEKIVLFHDQSNDPHAALKDGEFQVIQLRSRTFQRFLAKLAWNKLKRAVSRETIHSALQVLESKACFDGERIDLHVRVAWHKDNLFYDLGDGRAVQVDAEGWRIVSPPPILFRRLSHQKPQVTPIGGGKVDEILKFINLPDDKGFKLLFLVFLVLTLAPGFPHPVLPVHGVQGSAKSTLFKILKWLIDPSLITTLSPPENSREFVQVAYHHWFVGLDNIGYLPDWLSDALCRACTGDGYSKRELYTDQDDVIFQYHRIIGINGINLVVDKPDLLDRSLLIELERIPDAQRRDEKSLWSALEERKPYILGAMFDILPKAIKELPNVNLLGYPRMADFARWGVAVTRAMGFKDAEFQQAYDMNVKQQHEQAISASLVAQTVVSIVERRPEAVLSLNPTDLLAELNTEAEHLNINTNSRSWPKDPNWVWRRLNETRHNLEACGININRLDGTKRLIEIRKVGENAASADGVDDPEPTAPAAETPF